MDLKESGAALNRHPWELSRLHIAKKFLSEANGKTFLDVGCGDGFVLERLSSVGLTGHGVDKFAKPVANKIFNDLSEISDSSYDSIFLMDVLEHVKEDNFFLDEAMKKLKPGGFCLITVPAWQFLFSDHDRFLEHFRRYELKNLIKVVPGNAAIVSKHYFYFSLFLIRAIQFFLGNRTSAVTTWKYPEDHFLTKFFVLALDLDYIICRTFGFVGVKIPGLSCSVVLRKNS